ncbi:MAG: hypothetical protein EBU81_08620 [Proteobacteria bacterium]|jgi:hypothetical protein|nr:hypothetical protein [Pseudomonadota bacterium]
MTSISREQLLELRDKYLRGLRSLDAQMERLRSDRAATEGAAQAIAALLEEADRQATEHKAAVATD